jgi:hypothetical protein
MKTQANAKSGHNIANTAIERAVGLRSGAAKTFEHRYERRKIREQLRRRDWASNEADEIFA